MNFRSVLAVTCVILSISSVCPAEFIYIPAISVSGGENHSLILTDSNQIYGCGDNRTYQLGDGTSTTRIIPVEVQWPNDVNIIQIAAGTIGYIKFRYNSGPVSVSITADCAAYDVDCEEALFSPDILTFGPDPNE